MKITINKSAKRVLSIALALAMVMGTLFTANIGTNIIADAATTTVAEGTIDTLEYGSYLTEMGSSSTYYDSVLADNGETGDSWENAIIIDSAEELVYLCKDAGAATAGKYYKVADGIAGFDLSGGTIDLDGTLADNLTAITTSNKNHSGNQPGFQGNFDGNGVTVYGALVNGSTYAGLFPYTYGAVTIKNLNVTLSYFKGTTAAGGIVGYHKAGSMCTVTIENCSVTDTYLECTATGYGAGVGAVIGYGGSAPSFTDTDDTDGDGNTTETIWVNVEYNVNNCYVNLDETYFTSPGEDGTEASGERVCHGGVVGASGSNAVMVTNSVVVGVRPYSTTESTAYNDIQHTGHANNFKNVYTDQAVGSAIVVGGTTGSTQDLTAVMTQLTTAQLQGSAAVSNMSLEWFSAWLPGAEGEYPTLNQTGEESDTYFWDGTTASSFESGTGTKDDPYIIKTPAQLYLALTQITDTTNSVAGGVQTSQILKQDTTTNEYVPVYTPNYYKVADGVKNFYFNNVYGNETLDGAVAMAATSTRKDWKPGKSFVGHLDGNGVTIYGMYTSGGTGLVYKLDGSATVKNINFNTCYSTGTGNVALLTTNLGSYANDSTLINIANISVRNSYMATTRNITLTETASGSGLYTHSAGASGIVSTSNTCENLTIANCLYDGHSCERAIGSASESGVTADMMGGIISGGNGMNNVALSGCVALGAPAVDEVYISGKKVNYTRYDKNQGFQVFFYNSYSDVASSIATSYAGSFDKLADIERIAEQDAYEMYDMPKLAWSNWVLVTDGSRTFPMPTVNTADEIVGSYVNVIGKDHNANASVGPYESGSNPFTYKLKGSGTEEDPFIIETDAQLARAIATGGMNLYDKLYYKLGNDIDISGGLWINQTEVHVSGGTQYTYTPFGGVLDGDGHTVYGLTAGDSASAGLIPVLDGGTVKNLHLRDVTVVSGDYAGAITGWMYGGTVTGCSVENAVISSASGYGDGLYIVYNDDIWTPDEYGTITNSYYIGKDGDGNDITVYITDHNEDDGVVMATADEIKNNLDTSVWYIGGKEGSMPRLKAMAEKMDYADIDGDGIGSEYTANDLTSLRNNLLKKSAYANIFGDASRNGTTNIADLAVLQRTIAEDYGSVITDSFFANVQAGQIKIYYGENDNYDAARKVELYLEELTGVDVTKVVSSSKGTVSGANSDSSKVYLHAGDSTGTPDGSLEIIVGNIDNYSAYATNTVATADNTYAVTYDKDNKVVWLQGANFTAVEQAAINFTNGCSVQGDVVYTCASTVLADAKKPITVQLDTNFDGTVDTPTTMYYAWGDEFEEDTVNTYNWQHNSQQSEGSTGELTAYKNQEVAPVKDLNKVITVTNGRLSMKRGYDSKLGTSTNGTIPLDVTAGEFNGYTTYNSTTKGYDNQIDADGSDVYFSSGKITTERGMLYKQGYIEFQGQLPADGHAFPAWWLMGRPAQSQTNSGYDNSLYGKVYKLNSNWNGENNFDEDVLDSYKYQIPSAIYEIDMIEVMQHGSRYGTKKESTGIFGDGSGSYHDSDATYDNSTAIGWYQINSTIHKWWNNGVDNQNTSDTSDDLLYIQDWDNYQVLGGITNSNFSTTSTAGSWIHNIGSTVLDFGSSVSSHSELGGLVAYDYYDGSTTNDAAVAARNDLQATRKYGFSWNTNGVNGFEATLYVYNTDGTLRTTVPIASGMSSLNAFKDKNGNTEANGAIGSNASVYSDAKVFNQYMYVLLDNKFYSSNNSGYNAGKRDDVVMFTDLLTAAGLTSLEVDYVRVYQEDGYRDIVTPETESFNNNNHFGY